MATKSETGAAKKTADYSDKNVLEKLQAARNDFYAAGAKKTGKNPHAEFMYFELKDIVPIATEVFNKYRLMVIMSIAGDTAHATVYNLDRVEDTISFSIPFHLIAEPAKFRMNEVQGVGAAVTYYRRYLYMLILDLVESDEIDALKQKDDADAPQTVKKKPLTADEREAVKEELTDTDGNADELQIEGLKAALKKLMDVDADQEDFVQEIAIKTEGFEKLTRKQCEELIEGVNQMLASYNEVNV